MTLASGLTPVPEVKQHWAWTLLGWETAWELMVLLAWVWLSMLLRDSDEAEP